MNKLPVPLLTTVAWAFLISYYSLIIPSTSAKVDEIVTSSDYKNPKSRIQEIEKNFPDDLSNSALMERLSVLKGTIWEYEDIIQGQLDDPARSIWMWIIEKQNNTIEVLKLEQNPDELTQILYKEYKNQLLELVMFVEKYTTQQTNQCRKSVISG